MNSYDVVIPCHNSAETVTLAVRSALDCIEVAKVIVVDDGSSDQSPALLDSLDDPRVHVEHQTNCGPGSARNRGAAIATADRLIFLDADDLMLPDAVQVFDAHPSAQVARSGAIRVFPDRSEQVSLAEADPRPFPRGSPLAGSFTISRSLFERIGGYDERLRFGENTDLLLRAGQAVGGMQKVPCEARPTVRVAYTPGKNSSYYGRSRIAAIELVRTEHRRLLRQDPQMRRNFNAIATVLLRNEGDLGGSFRCATRAALVWPPEGRSCARVLRSMAELLVSLSSHPNPPDGLVEMRIPAAPPVGHTMGEMSDDLLDFAHRLATRFGSSVSVMEGASLVDSPAEECPVVIVKLEELSDLTDSTNEAIRKVVARSNAVLVQFAEQLDQAALADLAGRLAGSGIRPDFVGSLPDLDQGSLAIIRGSKYPVADAAPDEFRVVAIMTAYNEGDIVRSSVERLIASGVDVYLIDNWSEDDTVAQVADLVGHGLLAIEQFPPGGRVGKFDLSGLLEHVSEVALSLDHDWCVHHDVDQRREGPWLQHSYRDALHTAQEWGFNAVDHTILEFRPIDDEFADGTEVSSYHRFFEFVPGAASALHVQAWKNSDQVVDLAGSGGHDVAFSGRKVFPFNFILRHYPIRSQRQGERKVFAERKPSYPTAEMNRGWHSHYARMRKGHRFVRDSSELIEWDATKVRTDYLLPLLGQLGMRFPDPTARDIARANSVRLIQKLGLADTWVRLRNRMRRRVG